MPHGYWHFVICIKIEGFYKDIARCWCWKMIWHIYDEDDKRPLAIGKNKKVICLFKDELSGNIKKEFVGLTAKSYAYLMDNKTEHQKKQKGRKSVIVNLIMKSYQNSNKDLKVIIIMNILDK